MTFPPWQDIQSREHFSGRLCAWWRSIVWPQSWQRTARARVSVVHQTFCSLRVPSPVALAAAARRGEVSCNFIQKRTRGIPQECSSAAPRPVGTNLHYYVQNTCVRSPSARTRVHTENDRPVSSGKPRRRTRRWLMRLAAARATARAHLSQAPSAMRRAQ